MHDVMQNDSIPQNLLSQCAGLLCHSYAGRVAHRNHDLDPLQGQCFATESRQEPDGSRVDASGGMASSDPVVRIGKAMAVVDL
jgi:hypothetical protein